MGVFFAIGMISGTVGIKKEVYVFGYKQTQDINGDALVTFTLKNADTGNEVEFIMRVNQEDELQFVRHIVPADGTSERYDVVAKFGNRLPGNIRYAAERGHVVLDAALTSMDTAASNVTAQIESFSAYDDYRVIGALFPVSAKPTTDDVLNATTKYDSVSFFAAATATTTTATFTDMHDGTAIPNSLVKFAGIIQSQTSLAYSARPTISFVINTANPLTILNNQIAGFLSTAQPKSTMTFTIRITSVDWNTLSPTDRNIFSAWFRDQVLQGAKNKQITVSGLAVTITAGSAKATCELTFNTSETNRVLAAATSSDPTAMMNEPEKNPIPLVDTAPVTVTKAATETEVTEVVRIASGPAILSLAEASSSSTEVLVSFEVTDINPDFAVTKLYALTSTSRLSAPVVPTVIRDHPDVQEFQVSDTVGTIGVSLDAGARTFVYVVAENNDTPAVLSAAVNIVSEPFSMLVPSSVPLDSATGRYQIASQVPGTVGDIAVAPGLSVFSTAAGVESHLLLYPDGDASIPASAESAQAQLGDNSGNVVEQTDSSAPTFTSFSAASAGENSVTVSFGVIDNMDSTPSMAIALYASGSTPTIAEVIAGEGAGFLEKQTFSGASGTAVFLSLTAGTEYAAFGVAQDDVPNTSALQSASVSTDAAAAPEPEPVLIAPTMLSGSPFTDYGGGLYVLKKTLSAWGGAIGFELPETGEQEMQVIFDWRPLDGTSGEANGSSYVHGFHGFSTRPNGTFNIFNSGTLGPYGSVTTPWLQSVNGAYTVGVNAETGSYAGQYWVLVRTKGTDPAVPPEALA